VSLRILHFGTFEQRGGRNVILAHALQRAGAKVIACHATLWHDTTDKLLAARRGPWDPRVALRIVHTWLSLARKYLSVGSHDVLLVGSTGYSDLPLAWLLSRLTGKPLIFDPLISVTETIWDRQIGDHTEPGEPGQPTARPESTRSARLRIVEWLERTLLRLPDLIILDTRAHARYFEHHLGVAAARLRVITLGAEPAFARRPYAQPPTASPNCRLNVLYFGQYIPLHGVEVILRAAALLRDETDIHFTLVGTGQCLSQARALAERLELTNVSFRIDWLTPQQLVEEHIHTADVCVGIFGATPKARRVVPYKLFVALAQAKPVVTADTPALRELFEPGHDVLTCPPGDPAALADAVLWLRDRPDERAALARRGHAAFRRLCSAEELGRQWLGVLDTAVRPRAHGQPARAGSATPLGPRHTWRIGRLMQELDAATPGAMLLDAGCGRGTLTCLAAAGGYAAVGVDTELHALVEARRSWRRDFAPATHAPVATRNGGRQNGRPSADEGQHRRAAPGRPAQPPAYVCADVIALPFGGALFAAVVASELLEHVVDDRAALEECMRTLAPGGQCVVSVPATEAGNSRMGWQDQYLGHVRRYRRRQAVALCEQAGLRVERTATWGALFGRLYDRLVQTPALWLHSLGHAGALERAGTSRLARTTCYALFNADRVFGRLPFGAGHIVTARKLR
jgi:glycosyltransferase involved in cell wall biosynthesis